MLGTSLGSRSTSDEAICRLAFCVRIEDALRVAGMEIDWSAKADLHRHCPNDCLQG